MTPIIGFSPDSDPRTPGIFLECDNIIPSNFGMECAASLIVPQGGSPPLIADCRGAAIVANFGGVFRLFAGTATKMYELVSKVWTDVSGAAAYTTGGDGRWSFAGIGNDVLACNGIDLLVQSALMDDAGHEVPRLQEPKLLGIVYQ